jgi:hypothetical protein
MGGQVPGKSKFVESKPARIELVRVFDKGDIYDPPTAVDGSPLTPHDAASDILEHLVRMIGEASELPE